MQQVLKQRLDCVHALPRVGRHVPAWVLGSGPADRLRSKPRQQVRAAARRHPEVVVVVEQACALLRSEPKLELQVPHGVGLARDGREDVMLAKVHGPVEARRHLVADKNLAQPLGRGRVALRVHAETAVVRAGVHLEAVRLELGTEAPQRLGTIGRGHLAVKRATYVREPRLPRCVQRARTLGRGAAEDARSSLADDGVRRGKHRQPLQGGRLARAGHDHKKHTLSTQLRHKLHLQRATASGDAAVKWGRCTVRSETTPSPIVDAGRSRHPRRSPSALRSTSARLDSG
eukprot:scaffold15378_cov112-Isochrysis_galbana.AAC.1